MTADLPRRFRALALAGALMAWSFIPGDAIPWCKRLSVLRWLSRRGRAWVCDRNRYDPAFALAGRWRVWWARQ